MFQDTKPCFLLSSQVK